MGSDAAALTQIGTALRSQGVPDALVDALLQASSEMIDAYLADKLRPSELSGGDFVEAAARVLEHLSTGQCTPLGRSLPSFDRLRKDLESSTGLDDSLRVHIPRVLQMMYDVRNRRGVGHLPGPVSANRPDAQLLVVCAKWVLAEFVRLFHGTSHEQAQVLVDTLATRETPLVQEFEGVRRVVTHKSVSLPETILVLLASASAPVHRSELATWTRQPAKRIATTVQRLDERDLVHSYADGRVALTRLGELEAERLFGTLSR